MLPKYLSKIISLLFVLVFASTISIAQIKIGLNGGANFSTFTISGGTANITLKRKIGFSIGAITEYPLLKNLSVRINIGDTINQEKILFNIPNEVDTANLDKKKIDIFGGFGGLSIVKLHFGVGYFFQNNIEGYVNFFKFKNFLGNPEKVKGISLGIKILNNEKNTFIESLEIGSFTPMDHFFWENVKGGIFYEIGVGYLIRTDIGFHIEGMIKFGYKSTSGSHLRILSTFNIALGWSF